MPKGFMYILRCSNNTYYTGSTIDMDRRLSEHKAGLGAVYTKKWLPVELVYLEEFMQIDLAFQREKQVQNWSRAKKEALIASNFNMLHKLAECKNETNHLNKT